MQWRRTEATLTQQYSRAGEVAVVPTHWQLWQKQDVKKLLTGALGLAVGIYGAAVMTA